MLQKIIDFSIRNRLIIVLMVCGLIAAGAQSLRTLPIDAVPDITDNQVQIITTAPSLGAPDIERLITFPVEQSVANIPGLKSMRSFSRFGLSLLTVVFEDDVDLYWARQQVTARLQQVKDEIPSNIANPILAPVTTGLGEIYQYVIRPLKGFEGRFSASDIRTVQDWVVRRQLLHVKGVADVSSFGGDLKQYQISINPSLLKSYRITIDEVFNAIAKNNQNTGGAYIEKGPNVLFIRTEGLVGQMRDLANIVVKTNSEGVPILIKDLANVEEGHAIKYGALLYNGHQEVAGAVVMMLKGENSSQVVKNVKDKAKEINKMLPEGLVLEPFLDRTKMVNQAISTVQKNLLEGALIVIFILVLFLGNIRVGLITASVIPLSMLFAISLMKIFGVSGNLMSLGAIDFGLIVDGAVIIVEAVMHSLYHSKKFSPLAIVSQKEMNKEVSSSAGRMMNAAVFGQIIILIVYLPIFSLQGIEGKMFQPMAQTVAFALLGAFILSITYIPMMSAWFLSKKIPTIPSWSDRQMDKVEVFFIRVFTQLIRFPKIILTIVTVIFAVSMALMTLMGGEFIPQLEEGDFAVEVRALPGTSLPKMIERTGLAMKVLKENFPEVEKIVGKIGSGEIPTDPMPIEAADMMVILKPKSEWKTANSFPALADTMAKKLEEVPGLSFGFMFPVQMRFNELITGAKQDIVCKIFGENLDTLSVYASKLGKLINKVDGTKELYVEAITGIPQIVVTYSRTALSQYGMNIESLNTAINIAFAGKSAGQFYEGEKRFDIVLRMNGEQRKSIEDIQNLLVSTPSGLQMPLSTFAAVKFVNSPNQIQRENGARRIAVGFNVEGKDIQTVVQELQKIVATQVHLPNGYYITYGGTFENLQKAKYRLALAIPVALTLILVLLFFAFSSIKQAILVYTAIPLSSIGGVLLLALRGMPFSISAGIGFIALWGVAVLNGIVLIVEFNRLKKAYPDRNIMDVLKEGTRSRLRPVLMTASVASMGFIPMALSNGAGAEVQRPLATVVIGGLISATFLTLFVLPILYRWTMSSKKVVRTKAVLFILFGLGSAFSSSVQAQEKNISLENALDSAAKNHRNLLSITAESDYFEAMQRTVAADLPKTMVQGEFGHVNSQYVDNKIGISQTFEFPAVFKAKQQLFAAAALKSKAGYKLELLQVQNQLRSIFYDYQVLLEREKLLKFADSIFRNFKQKSDLRLKYGDSNGLEQASADNQLAQVNVQILALVKQKEQLQQQFQYLLQTKEIYKPKIASIKIDEIQLPISVQEHPGLAVFSADAKDILAQQRISRSAVLPEIVLGGTSQTFVGYQQVGGDEVYFGTNKRFFSLNVGVNFKLFGLGAQKRKNRSFDLLMRKNRSDTEARQLSLENELHFWTQELKNAQETLNLYESSLLLNSKKTIEMADKRLQLGDINYLNWVVLIQQNIQIRASYLDVVSQYNHAIIQLLNFKN